MLLLIASLAAYGARSPRAAAAEPQLPPITYVCPMAEHAQVVEDKPGTCPLCSMVLEPVRIDSAWSCPIHPIVITDKAGRCPLDKRELVQVAVALYWSCPDKPKDKLTEPGRCGDGKARRMVREHRAHGDHNPKHGGQLFMAANRWHHLEATYPAAGVVRVYIYDNFTQPMTVKEFRGRVVSNETFDAKTGTSREIDTFSLKPSRDGRSLEARIGNMPQPVKLTVKMRFDRKGAEERFDFSFDTVSKEPASAPVAQTAARAVSPPPAPQPSAAQGPAQAAAGMTTIVAPFDPAQLAEPLPASAPELLQILTRRAEEVQTLIAGGQFGAVYVPAILTKDIALALDNHVQSLPAARQVQAAAAIKRVVLAAWQLDAYGDLGDGRKLADAHAVFAAAVSDLKVAYAAP